jgi:hypothetical protein
MARVKKTKFNKSNFSVSKVSTKYLPNKSDNKAHFDYYLNKNKKSYQDSEKNTYLGLRSK